MRLFIGCSSNENMPKEYVDDCTNLLEVVLKDNDLVFGAYDKGLMGVSYRIAKKNNRKVTGMCPEVYKENMKSLECDKEVVTKSIIDSTIQIYENSDAIIFLPGGFGSLYEFFTANYFKVCKELDIPIIIYNSCGYYDKLISFIKDMDEMGIIRKNESGHYFVANSVDEVVDYLKKKMLSKK